MMPTADEIAEATRDFDRVMTVRQCAATPGYTESAVRYAVRYGYVIGESHGTRLLISRSSWETYVNKRTQ